MNCKWNGSGNPRIVPGRHAEDAYPHDSDHECRGCLPCTEPHCRVCEREHSDGTCAECLAETRANLHEIARMCDALPEEVEHRGIDGEAMMLLGPTADPEARGHLEASIEAGRVPADYLDAADSDKHPLYVLGTWDMVWRDALDHGEGGKLTVAGAVDYLDRQMAYMGGYEHVPFEDFARDLRACVAHLESVLHDGEQVERGAPCPMCGNAALRKRYGDSEGGDRWICPRRDCRATYTEHDYRTKVDAVYVLNAEALTASQIREAYRVPEGTVRQWASRGIVHKRGRDQAGRMLYDVRDTLTMRDKQDSESA